VPSLYALNNALKASDRHGFASILKGIVSICAPDLSNDGVRETKGSGAREAFQLATSKHIELTHITTKH